MPRSSGGSSPPTCRSAIARRSPSISRARRSSKPRPGGACNAKSITHPPCMGAMTMTDTFARYPSLARRTVLVTGGASGIGAAIVEAFCQQGARVAFLDRDETAAAKLLGQPGTGGEAPLFLSCDLTDIAALRAAIARAAAALGPITTLINNAARDDRHAIEAVTPEMWDGIMANNLRHQFFAAQAVIAGMAAAGGGAIVNLGSISWVVG